MKGTRMSFIHTEYSYMTEEELLTKVESMETPTSLEIELAARLKAALHYIDELSEMEDELALALAPAGGSC